jgi:HlyD family secretion protein
MMSLWDLVRPAECKPYGSDGVRAALASGAVVVGLLVFGGGVWAGTASLSGAVLAPGKVVVESNVKKVQHATGGTIGEIFVEDGDRVERDTLLIKLDETITRANLQIITKQLDELATQQMRLLAEQEGRDSLSVPSALSSRMRDAEVAALVAAERQLFESRRDALMGQKAQLRERIAQFRQEADGLAAQQWAKGREIELAAKELEGAEQLWERKLVSIAKFTALRRESTRLEGERANLQAQQAQTKGRITEIELKIIQLDQDQRTEVMKELREVTAKQAELGERRIAAEDQLRHVEIRAPRTGTVHQLSVHTVGGVVAQGETLMLIVPEQDALVVEAKIAPQDIDNVRVGQPAFIRFSAFNQRITPEFDGQVTHVSADLTTEQQTGLSYYIARLSLSSEVKARDKRGSLSLVPGMPADVHIRTGERTAMSYFLKPLSDQFARAFTED